MLGTVYNTFKNKGFGFLIDEKGVNRFFHFSSLLLDETIDPGDIVAFDEKRNEQGEIAERLAKMSITNLSIKPSNYDEVLEKIKIKETIPEKKQIIKKQFPISYIHKMSVSDLVEKNCLDLDFGMIYQDLSEIDQSNLITMILYHLPVSSIIVHKSSNGLRVIKGEQLLKTLHDFIQNQFHIEFNVLRPELTGNYFSQKPSLSEKTQGYLLNLNLPIQYIEGELSDEVIDEIEQYYKFMI